ncbi:hypothetical protein BCY91_10965 [Pelobium manganitolerans]|uniref:Toprim domain-containing protein n=1 Tax=Pelobium manganitolerans TaxID=1842495 RepID=A0A419S204_9SPHI|nr:toprim domain-containing protein [Pelobium manganitolerans]RKD12765.1 hypothetical protein BCY91_10965 [Pelobium manganitolerans]
MGIVVGPRNFRGVGFKNDLGGYEIRSAFYKYSSAPKSSSTFCRNSNTVKVFEGFMDFLSYVTVEDKFPVLHDIMVLNGTGQFEKSKPFLERYKTVELYLDNDPTGNKITHNALKSSPKFVDCSKLYRPYNDLNEWLIMKGFSRKSKQALKL